MDNYILEINRNTQNILERGSITYQRIRHMFSFPPDVALKYCRLCQHNFLKLQHNLDSQKGALKSWLVQTRGLHEPGPLWHDI